MQQDNLPNLPGDKDSPSPIPLTPLKREQRGFLASAARAAKALALAAAGYDDPEIAAKCRRGEINSAVVRGTITLLYAVLLAGGFSFIGHYLAHSSFDLMITLRAVFLATFFALALHYVTVRGSSFPDGMKGLRHGGFPVDIPIGTGAMARACLIAHFALTGTFAAAFILVAGLSFNESAINRRLAADSMKPNITLALRAEKVEDGKRDVARKRYESAIATEQGLTTENERLVKQANRSSSASTSARLSANEGRLAQARAAVTDRKQELDATDANRTSSIEVEIKHSPLYVPTDDSLIAKIRALFSEIHDNPWVAFPLGIIGVAAAGIDLIVLIVLKGISMPSSYNMASTRNSLASMVEESRLALDETTPDSISLAPSEGDDDPPDIPPNPPGGQPMRPPGTNGATPPRRPVGRPKGSMSKRTNVLDAAAKEPDHD